MKELKDFYSFDNFLNDINSSKTFDNVSYNFSNDMDELKKFLKEKNLSFFEFYTGVLSLYLSRISSSGGIIFTYDHLNSEDTLFKIKYDDKVSIFDFIIYVKNIINNALDNSMENLKDFVNELYPEYCDYIFNYTIVNQNMDNPLKNNNDSHIIFMISKDSIEVEYNINTFNRLEIEFMLENIEFIVNNFLNDINTPCGVVDIVCSSQLNLLNQFSKGNDFKIAYKSIPNFIFEMAEKYPDNFAINDEINRITYKELADLIKSISYILQNDYEIGKYDKILIYLPRSYYIPLLTVCLMNLCAVAIPVDDDYPKTYIQSIINNCSPKYVIQVFDYNFDDVESILLDSLKNGKSGRLMDVNVDLDDTAIILYTSGSTGVPKGVELTQRNIIDVNYNAIDFLNISEASNGNFMCLAKFTFVASIPIYGALIHGFEAFIIRETSKESISNIIKYLKTYHCFLLISTQELGLYLYNNFNLNLDNLALAGSSLSKAKVRDDSSTVLWNTYGCTETSGSVMANKINKDFTDYSVIGKPLGNSKVYILDDNKKQLPIGAIGELVIGGSVVTKQYLNNPEQTNKAYGEFNGERVFFTNDLAYFKPDGGVVYVGRKDNQINLNGFRIEPDGVESTISEFGGFNQVKVLVGKVNRQDHLIAYYSSSIDIDEEALKEYLSIHLPSYMVPSFYVHMDNLPLNPNGKIDVRRLPPVDLDEVEFVEPRNEWEELVVDCFVKAFNQENISVLDDFIELGGTSVIAMKILGDLDDYNLSSSDLVTLRTPEKIAEHIKENKLVSFDWDKYSFDSGCPLNESQLNVYLDIQRNENNAAYNLHFIMDVSQYSMEDVNTALEKMFDVHSILTTHVENIDGIPYLKAGNVPVVDFCDVYVKDDVLNFICNPFDLNDSLARFLLIKDNDERVLVAVFHHLIFDGFSSLVFKQHLFDLLEYKSLDKDVGFIKSSIYDEEIAKSEVYGEAEAFYESMLCDVDDTVSLLSCVESTQARDVSFDLLATKNDIGDFLKVNAVSENVLFTGVFAYTLSRFVGDDKALFNIVENGRDKCNIFNSIGMFANTLPLLVDCKNQDIVSFIKQVSDLIQGVVEYNFYPFRLLANRFGINSDILFQFLPEWDSESRDIVSVDISENDVIRSIGGLINDLTVQVIQQSENYILNIKYSGKYSDDFVNRFAESYKLILHDMLNVERLEDIIFTSEEDIKLLESYNQTESSFEFDDILEAFNHNLVECENNVLVGYKDKTYSHGQGAFIANKISDKLTELGVVKQDFVSLFLNRSEWFLLAIMGVLACGAIYVPIETSYPGERITLMLKDTQSSVVIVDDNSEKHMKNIIADNNLEINILNVSNILDEDINTSNQLDAVDIDENAIACALYTSGTTGTPKGVLITRKAVNNFVSWYISETNFTCDDVYGMHCSYVFDIHTAALFSPVISGGCLYIVPEDIRLDLKALNDFYVEYRCTHTYITSQVGKLFAESNTETTIKLLCFGGMKLGELNARDSIGPFETYGPSENLAISTSIFANKRIHHTSIGYYISNVKGYVLDNEHRRVPIGAVGELYLSGHQLTTGYLNRDEENAKAFFSNPFDDEKGYETIYRTGDIVRVLPDGSLGIIGRRDSQVKIRGNRVELSEVESVIRKCDIVDDVIVQTVDNKGNNELVAYVVVSSQLHDIDLTYVICEYVYNRKPDYMVPSYVIRLDTIPLNVNGKVDKRALPDVDLVSLRVEYVAPRNNTERDIVDAFEQVFNLDNIGIYDDFIRLGGDSLTAIRLLTFIEGYNISVADVLSLRTPYMIANNINDISMDLDVYSLDSGCPLSESQLNVYLDILANDKVDSYIIPLYMNLPKVYDFHSIGDALNEMLRVHPILGMCISDDFDVPYLIKGSDPLIRLESCGVDDEVIVEFLTKSFDLHDSLCRFLIVDDGEFYCLFAVFHHLIFDALSSSVFERDLLSILEGESIDVDDSFLKASAFSKQIQDTDKYVAAEGFYESMFASSDESFDLLDCVGADGPGSIDLDLGLDYDLFKSFLRSYGVSESVVFTGAFAYTLSRFAGGDNVLFDIVENGRDRLHNYDSIGMFVNTLPLLVDCKNQSVDSFMEYMSDCVYGVMKYNYYPFRQLAKEYNVASDIIFQFLPSLDGNNNDFYGSGIFEEYDLLKNQNDFISDLSANVVWNGDGYSLFVRYSGKYSLEFVEKFMESYKLILHGIITSNDLSDINYITQDDIELLDSYNNTEHDLEYDDVLDAFNSNLARYPDNALVSFNDRFYSYVEGAFIADMIAKKLIDLGVRVGDCVGFLTERSEYYMFCVLGILSVGAVYVPLDDILPDERLEFMLDDTGSKVLIVSDETYGRAQDLTDDNIMLLNISDIMNDGIGCLSCLPVVYGDLACILYTSGTTGIPKGVKITRKSIVNYVDYYVGKSGFCADDVFSMYASIGFDVGAVKSIFAPVYAGACLDVIPYDIRLDIAKLNQHFINYNVTHADLPSQVAKLFISEVENTSLNVLVVGGDNLGDIDFSGDYLFVDAYGPTEACVSVTSTEVLNKIHYSSVGKLFNNIKAFVIDGEYRRVPVGAVGELCLSGYQIADGYLNRGKETQESFIKNPFDDNEDYNVLYRTGDLVRVLPDGSLGIVGRCDSQVKIRGNRVELSEIESVIRDLDYVEDVTVQTIKNGDNYELVAYVVSKLDDNILEESIKGDIMKCKPNYMVPSFVIRLDAIPLNVNGKVDKRALPEVDLDSLRVEYVAPSNDVEVFFVKCFEELLSIDKVSVNDIFFDLGGDSLLAIKVIYKAINEGYSITYADLFNNPTPRLLSKIVLHGGEVSVYDDYDYSLIDDLLGENNLYSFYNGECVDSLGNVLLLGSTGFIGMHVLYELLINESAIIYCFIWSSEDLCSEDEFRELFNFYFDSDFEEFKDRLYFVEGDVNNMDDFMRLREYDVDTVINCATNVKHHAYGSEIKDVNLYGAVNGLEFAKFKGARFVQVSTSLVAGHIVEGMSRDICLYEDQLYIGQNYSANEYVESKFLAERAVLEYKVNYGLDVKIMRIIVMNYDDSRFENSYYTDPFIEYMKSLITVGKVPKFYLDVDVGAFSPVDSTARAIVILSKTPKECIVFHPFNNHSFTFKDIVNVFNKLGLDLEIVDDEVFMDDFSNILRNERKQEGLFGIVSNLNRNRALGKSISINNDYTMEVLSEFDFKWPKTSEDDLFNLISSFMRRGYFKL